jgi:predicted nucleotidyltransferase
LNKEQSQIISLLNHCSCVEVAWLYGSRAINKHTAVSDYDIAVALLPDVEDRTTMVDDLQYTLSNELNGQVSIVDINHIPIPLAQNVVAQGKVLLCRSDLRLRQEQQRIWSLWEEYKYQHERNRKAL